MQISAELPRDFTVWKSFHNILKDLDVFKRRSEMLWLKGDKFRVKEPDLLLEDKSKWPAKLLTTLYSLKSGDYKQLNKLDSNTTGESNPDVHLL